MSLSLLTNAGAMTALQTMNKTQKNLLQTQSRISTGLKVSNAQDNAATWAISTTMKSDVTGLKAIQENLSLSSSTISTARGAAEQISTLIGQIKGKVTSAENSAVDKVKVQSDIDGLMGQINSIVSGSQFNGVNLINSQGSYNILGSLDRSSTGVSTTYINVSNQDLRVTGGQLSSLANISVVERGTDLLGATGSATTVIAGANATSDMEGTKQVEFQGGAAPATGAVTFTYTDSAGATQTVTANSTAATNTGTVNALNNTSEFSAHFFAEVGAGANDVRIMAKNRATDSSYNIVSLGGAAFNGGTGVNTSATQTRTAMSFQSGEPLKDGEVIQIDYSINGASHTVKLQAADAANGTLLGTDSSGNKILALNSAVVTAYNVTGSGMADAIRGALVSNNELQTGGAYHFAVGGAATAAGAVGAAVDGATIGLSANGSANLFAASVDGTDAINHFTLPVTDYASVLGRVETALSAATNAASAFGSAQSRIDTQKEFVGAMVDSLNTGIGNLVDADMTEESARLQALQVQQQLGVQALSIANQSPQSILSLFR